MDKGLENTIYITLEALLGSLETPEELEVLIGAMEDFEKAGYSLSGFRKKYQERIDELRERYDNGGK